MRYLLLAISFLVVVSGSAINKEVSSEDKSKYFFTMARTVTFTNTPCLTTHNEVGTCYSSQECFNRSGVEDGTCAEGFGVCCVVMRTCGDSTCFNNTYFVNDKFPTPSSTAQMCTFTVNPMEDVKVHQILLTFEYFDLLGPHMGDCKNDSFVVSGMNSGSSVPVLCGNNTAQHMYIDVDEVTGPYKLTITTSPSVASRKWKIRVQQLTVEDQCVAPKRCLQYYKQATGTVKSYNLDDEGNGQLLNKNKYAVCFGSLAGFCDIGLMEKMVDLPGVGTNNCFENYIAIMGNKYCGQTLNEGNIRMNATGPPTVYVNTGTINLSEARGFKFDFMQMPCVH